MVIFMIFGKNQTNAQNFNPVKPPLTGCVHVPKAIVGKNGRMYIVSYVSDIANNFEYKDALIEERAGDSIISSYRYSREDVGINPVDLTIEDDAIVILNSISTEPNLYGISTLRLSTELDSIEEISSTLISDQLVPINFIGKSFIVGTDNVVNTNGWYSGDFKTEMWSPASGGFIKSTLVDGKFPTKAVFENGTLAIALKPNDFDAPQSVLTLYEDGSNWEKSVFGNPQQLSFSDDLVRVYTAAPPLAETVCRTFTNDGIQIGEDIVVSEDQVIGFLRVIPATDGKRTVLATPDGVVLEARDFNSDITNIDIIDTYVSEGVIYYLCVASIGIPGQELYFFGSTRAISTGIKDQNTVKVPDVHIFTSENQLIVSGKDLEKETLRVITANGQLVGEYPRATEHKITLPTGLYIAQIGHTVRKVIVQ